MKGIEERVVDIRGDRWEGQVLLPICDGKGEIKLGMNTYEWVLVNMFGQVQLWVYQASRRGTDLKIGLFDWETGINNAANDSTAVAELVKAMDEKFQLIHEYLSHKT